MQPIIPVFAAFATLMVAFSAYYCGVIKAQERIDKETLCNLIGYRNSAYFVGRYIIDTLNNKADPFRVVAKACLGRLQRGLMCSVPTAPDNARV